ncbi:MAG: FUSC family protein [Ruminococcaceae bacterium]|nr:FUSC family protein [Oscillospiraceae bacterium]
MKTLKKTLRLWGSHVDPKAAKMLISTAIGVVVYMVLAQFLPMVYPMFILNTLFVVTSVDLGLTKTASLERMVGTAAAIGIGLLCFFLAGGQSWIIPFGLLVVTLLTLLFFRRVVNVMLVCATMLMCNTSGGHPFLYASSRVINTLIGLGIALVVAVLYTHPYPRRPVYEEYAAMLKDVEGMIEADDSGQAPTPAALLEKITALTALEVKMTRDTGVLSVPFRKRIIALTEDINQLLCHLGVLQALPQDDPARADREKRIQELRAHAHTLMAELDAL